MAIKGQGTGTVLKKCKCAAKARCGHGWTLRYWADGKQPEAVAISTISPGTVITIANWRQYQQFMPDGMITLF